VMTLIFFLFCWSSAFLLSKVHINVLIILEIKP
jgi:hypothetical protein